MKTLEGGKLYISLISIIVLLAGYYFFKGATSKPIGQQMMEQQEQALQDESAKIREMALKWAVLYFSTKDGKDAWLAALKPYTSEELNKELTAVIKGELKSSDEVLNQTRSYLEAKQEQNVQISTSGLFQEEADWHVSLMAEAYYENVKVDISGEIVITKAGDELKVSDASFQDLGN